MRLQRLLLVGGLALFGLIRPVVAKAQSPSRAFLVYVTESAEHVNLGPGEHLLIFRFPILIPGASLEPGPYIFRQLRPSIIQVLAANRSTIYATFITISGSSGDGDDDKERIRFEQSPGDEAPRMTGWYLPGRIGYEFLYPKPKRKPAERAAER